MENFATAEKIAINAILKVHHKKSMQITAVSNLFKQKALASKIDFGHELEVATLAFLSPGLFFNSPIQPIHFPG